MVAVLRAAAPEELFEVIGRAEQAAAAHVAPEALTQALRRVLSSELAHRD